MCLARSKCNRYSVIIYAMPITVILRQSSRVIHLGREKHLTNLRNVPGPLKQARFNYTGRNAHCLHTKWNSWTSHFTLPTGDSLACEEWHQKAVEPKGVTNLESLLSLTTYF